MKKASIDTIFEQGEPNPYGRFFTGQTYLTRLSANDTTWNSSLANVTFEPGARTNWHKHSGGQILLVLGGEGRYQERNGEIRVLKKGDVVRIPLNVEHWHGAAPNSWFTHISSSRPPARPADRAFPSPLYGGRSSPSWSDSAGSCP